VFNAPIKERWATTFKGDMQTEKIVIPPHRELQEQIHGIKRDKTENTGLFRFKGEKDDMFWSLMLALYGEGRTPTRFHLIGKR
jgi:hypothetical protein